MSDIEDRKREAAELITELLAVEFTPRREMKIISRLGEICPDPAFSTRIYHDPDTKGPDGYACVDLVVEKIFSYKPIQLPDRSDEILR